MLTPRPDRQRRLHVGRRAFAVVVPGLLAAFLISPASPAAAQGGPGIVGAPPAGFDVADFAPQLARAPYLTDLVELNATVNWATDQASKVASLRYGAVAGDGTCAPTISVQATRRSVKVGTYNYYQWKVGLHLPGPGAYCYRPYLGSIDLLGSNAAPRFLTQVPQAGTEPFSFAVFGDWGQVDANGDNDDQANLMSQVAASGVRFAMTVGDNGYPNGSQINYGDLRQKAKNTSAIFGPRFWTVAGATVPIFPAVGNHGVSGSAHTDINTWTQDQAVATSGGRYQNDVSCCVNQTASANYASEWYAFDAGPARFYVLDSAWSDSNVGNGSPYANDAAAHFAPGTPEYEWLQNDLQTHPSQLKFAFSHFPFYADNPTEGSDPFLQGPDNLEGLLGRYGVNIVFNGHGHFYQRNLPSGPEMPVTYVTGGGGGTLEPIGPCTPNDAYGIGWSPTKLKGSACGGAAPPTAASQVFHFLKVTVTGSTVTVAPTDSLGNVFDQQTYTFTPAPVDTNPPSTPQSLTATSDSAFSVALSWQASNDDQGVVAYEVYRDGARLSSVTGTAFDDDTVLADSTHSYTVVARDAAGNRSDPSQPAPVTTPDSPVPLFADGFESGGLDAWTSSGGLQPEGGEVAHGSWAVEGATTNGATYAKVTLAGTHPDGYSRVLFDIKTQSSQVNLLRLRTAGGTSLGYVYVTPGGMLGFRNDTVKTSSASQVYVTPGWHALELRIRTGAGSGDLGAVQVWYDGDLVPALSSDAVATGSTPVGALQIGDTVTKRTYDVAFDDVAFATSRLGPVPDTVAPSVPADLAASAAGPTAVTLQWSSATDNVGFLGYDVFRDGSRLASTLSTGYVDTSVTPGATYSYSVRAEDTTGNLSARSDAVPVTVPSAGQTPVFADGFESGDLSRWNSSRGLAVEGSDVRTGSWAAEGNTTTGATYAKKTLPSSYPNAYAQVAFLVESQVSQLNLLRLRDGSGNSIGYVFLTTAGALGFHSDADGSTVSTPVALGPGWHTLQLHVVVNSTSSLREVWLDGTSIGGLSSSTADLGSAPVGGVQIGETTTGRTYDVIFDDVVFDTSRIPS